MQRMLRSFALLLLLSAPLSALMAQPGAPSGIEHCNLFYLTSDHPEILPFQEECYLADHYTIPDPHTVRVKGPITEQTDIFRDYPWSMTFFMPDVKADQKLLVKMPENFAEINQKAAAGTFFMYISDNRTRQKAGEGADEVDYVPVSGKAKITEYKEPAAGGNYPYYNLQFDMMVRAVDRTGAQPVLTGPEIRVKGVLKVEEIK